MEAGEPGGGGDWDGHGAKRDRSGVGHQYGGSRPERRKAQGQQHGGGDGHRCAESGKGLKEAAEAEGNEDTLQADVTAADHIEDAARSSKRPLSTVTW